MTEFLNSACENSATPRIVQIEEFLKNAETLLPTEYLNSLLPNYTLLFFFNFH